MLGRWCLIRNPQVASRGESSMGQTRAGKPREKKDSLKEVTVETNTSLVIQSQVNLPSTDSLIVNKQPLPLVTGRVEHSNDPPDTSPLLDLGKALLHSRIPIPSKR